MPKTWAVDKVLGTIKCTNWCEKCPNFCKLVHETIGFVQGRVVKKTVRTNSKDAKIGFFCIAVDSEQKPECQIRPYARKKIGGTIKI